ncbi:MAG: amino acid ABC transporter [Bellilinea sp.]|nr:MAG: amino acid ABC transporter [Bellilinea sp.]
MAVKETIEAKGQIASPPLTGTELREKIRNFPWWIVGLVGFFVLTAHLVLTRASYQEAFSFIRAGVGVTIQTTLIAYGFALILGLLTGLGRISNNVIIQNVGTLYVELIRGIPMLVLIFFIAFVGVPAGVGLLNRIGEWFSQLGLLFIAQPLLRLENSAVPMTTRAIIALSVTYGAFQAEIFRAGIQSIGRGQMEAARAQGMSYWQAMRFIILPQAIRNVLPALGNDFVSMLKDSSLVSVLAVRDITQIAKLYAGRSFQYQEAYVTLAALYLMMTVVLSAFVKWLERRVRQDERNA